MTNVLLPKVEQALQASHITYKAFPCDPELADTAVFCERYGFSAEQSANTILVASKTDPVRYAACVVLATTKLDVNKKVRELLGVKKASFAPMDKALELSGMEYGGVTIFGLPQEVSLYVDARVLDQDEIVMGGGNRSSKVILPAAELKKFPGAQIIPDLAKPIDA